MSSRDDERRVLNAIENQLRTENPELMGSFAALGSVTTPIKPVNGWGPAGSDRKPARRGRNRDTSQDVKSIVVEFVLVIMAVVLVAVLTVGAVGLLTA